MILLATLLAAASGEIQHIRPAHHENGTPKWAFRSGSNRKPNGAPVLRCSIKASYPTGQHLTIEKYYDSMEVFGQLSETTSFLFNLTSNYDATLAVKKNVKLYLSFYFPRTLDGPPKTVSDFWAKATYKRYETWASTEDFSPLLVFDFNSNLEGRNKKSKLLDWMKRSPNLTLETNKKELGKYSLKGSSAAISRLQNC